MKAAFFILVGLMASTPALGLIASPWTGGGLEAPRPWIHAMEASMQPLPTETSTSAGTLLGWFLAAVFFITLLNLHLKMRRRDQMLLRSGHRDIVILPPARNRRRHPR